MSSSVIETIKEVVSNMNRGLYDFTVDGKCSECGSCCSNFLPISSKEIKQIEWYIRKHHIKECRHNFTASLMDLTCPFLMDDKAKEKCSIYPVRPEICKSFVCNDPQGARKNKALMHKKYKPVDMRETFFVGE